MKLRSCFIGIKAFSLAELFEGFRLFLVGINQTEERKLSEKSGKKTPVATAVTFGALTL